MIDYFLKNPLSLPTEATHDDANQPFYRSRPFVRHSVEETYRLHGLLGRMFQDSSAVILDVEHDEEIIRRFPRPVMEDGPYWFQGTQEQFLDLAQEIQRALRQPEDDAKKE